MSNVIERKFYADGCVRQTETNTTAISLPDPKIGQKTIIQEYLKHVLNDLRENEADSVEDGGLPVTTATKDYLMNAAAFVYDEARQNSHYSIEDFQLTPFAREDGSAYLLITFLKTNRRVSILIKPDAVCNRMSFSSGDGNPHGNDIDVLDNVGVRKIMSWLTREN